jgi:hypothetical protein
VYDPTLGRWLQRDPAGYVDGVHPYAYVASKPTYYLDPTGLKADSCVFGQFTYDLAKFDLVSTLSRLFGGENSPWDFTVKLVLRAKGAACTSFDCCRKGGLRWSYEAEVGLRVQIELGYHFGPKIHKSYSHWSGHYTFDGRAGVRVYGGVRADLTGKLKVDFCGRRNPKACGMTLGARGKLSGYLGGEFSVRGYLKRKGWWSWEKRVAFSGGVRATVATTLGIDCDRKRCTAYKDKTSIAFRAYYSIRVSRFQKTGSVEGRYRLGTRSAIGFDTPPFVNYLGRSIASSYFPRSWD